MKEIPVNARFTCSVGLRCPYMSDAQKIVLLETGLPSGHAYAYPVHGNVPLSGCAYDTAGKCPEHSHKAKVLCMKPSYQ